MTERDPWPGLHESIFVKLVAIMIVMATCLLGMVAGFYFFVVMPSLHVSLDRLVGKYARAVAASAPDSATAHRLAASLEMDVRYEGSEGTWSTSESVPTVEALMEMRANLRRSHFGFPGRAFYIVRGPHGGQYIFERRFGQHFQAAHSKMLLMLLVLMVGVFVTAYWTFRRALRPLRWLNEGVTRLSEGHLDIVVPNPSRDEFGVLTHAFNRMAGRVKEMVRARDQLLLDVSHELRSPLTRLKVALALLPGGPHRAGMAADLNEMESMITELLELERLREGGGIRTERHDLIPILRDGVESFKERPPGVRFAPAVPGLLLDIDADRVCTVIRNVLENAIKYSLPDSRAVEVTAADAGRTVVVRFDDDGPGIPRDDMESLFEPFFRLDRSRSKKTGGYGLGLSICKRIMEAHGGTIAVENRAGRGASFILTFPKPA